MMESLAAFAFTLGVVGYSVGGTCAFAELLRRKPGPLSRVLPWAFALGMAAHLLHIVGASFATRICPVESLPFALSLAALVMVLAFLGLRKGRSLDALGIFVAPLALAFLVSAQFIHEAPRHSALSRGLLGLHVMSNLLGLGLVLLSGAASVLFLWVERRLKRKRLLSGGSRLPPLDSLDRLVQRLTLLAFPLLTFGVVTGGLFTAQLTKLSVFAQARAGLGYLAWALVALVLLSRTLWGWRGRKSAIGTLLGVLSLCAVLLSYMFESRTSSSPLGLFVPHAVLGGER